MEKVLNPLMELDGLQLQLEESGSTGDATDLVPQVAAITITGHSTYPSVDSENETRDGDSTASGDGEEVAVEGVRKAVLKNGPHFARNSRATHH